MEKKTFPVEGMSCAHCVMHVTKALKGIDGVQEAQVNLDSSSAEVTYDPAKVTPEVLHAAVDKAGYNLRIS